MSLIDKFLDAIKLNDDFDQDDDYLDDENEEPAEEAAEEPVEEERSRRPRAKTRKRFLQKFADRKEARKYDEDEEEEEAEDIPSDSFYDDEYDDEYDHEEEDPEPVYSRRRPARETGSYEPYSRESRSRVRETDTKSARREADHTQKRSKVTPIRGRKSPSPAMEVNVVRPSSMEDTWEIADTLLDGCTVVINLEGLDVDVAQRVVDFTCGVCYSLGGNLQKISNYIFLLTPAGVDISGDFQNFLNGAFDIPPMRAQY
ncbi:MAG: cell division protein SepF [Eubacteriales bacterium]|jgi:cell division inhibitor SepF|nr:cell division protein SepF [Lachnospiraceae bacterium]MDD5859066.1 cell division protein SepF [Eubacteriales bacterium]MCH4064612.1 cell division protein SepF [Lachnospiraceae bacterium]MCH4104843.1 cell division protein SepF [Lachnospiraceae bacterium]MCI1309772.1 cell division protein SepF [Lachnospiraceae bacterium]